MYRNLFDSGHEMTVMKRYLWYGLCDIVYAVRIICYGLYQIDHGHTFVKMLSMNHAAWSIGMFLLTSSKTVLDSVCLGMNNLELIDKYNNFTSKFISDKPRSTKLDATRSAGCDAANARLLRTICLAARTFVAAVILSITRNFSDHVNVVWWICSESLYWLRRVYNNIFSI